MLLALFTNVFYGALFFGRALLCRPNEISCVLGLKDLRHPRFLVGVLWWAFCGGRFVVGIPEISHEKSRA